MKVLLCEDVDSLGWYGDIVNVNDGYARNYLLPQGLATAPNESIIKAMAEEKARRAEHRNLIRQQLEKLAAAVADAEVEMVAKTNEMGHLFGSVTERDIADKLREKGFEIKDQMIRLSHGHLKELGNYEVNLRIAQDIKTQITVRVISDQQPQESEELQPQQEDTVESIEENNEES